MTDTALDGLRAAVERALRPCIRRYIPHAPTNKQLALLLYEGREAMYGGAGGGGKTDALLMAALQYVCVPGYNAALFRQTFPQLAMPGQFVDRAEEWLGGSDARYVAGNKQWVFPSGAQMTFGFIERDSDRFGWAGPELQYVGWDELTNWSTDKVYRFVSFSRSRRPMPTADMARCPDCGLSLADVPLRTRSGTNPGGPGHDWVLERFVQPWMDRQAAIAAGEPAGTLDKPFFPARLEDNPHIDQVEYAASLDNLDPIERARIKRGDWSAREEGGMFRREWFPIVDDWPRDAEQLRYWDLAGSEATKKSDPDWTVGVRMALKDGQVWVLDMIRLRATAFEVDRAVLQAAQLDGRKVTIRVEQEPSSSGKRTIAQFHRLLIGFAFKGVLSRESKAIRNRGLASAAEAGNVRLVRGSWNKAWLDEVEMFPTTGIHDDIPDASAGAFNELIKIGKAKVRPAGRLSEL